jgi:hypothetical protein
MRRPTREPHVILPNLKESKPFCSPQDQIQWGILFLSRHLRGSSPWEREECLQDVWDWARKQGNLLCLQIIRDYRECLKESGLTYRRHQVLCVENGKIAEEIGLDDGVTALQQLGILKAA